MAFGISLVWWLVLGAILQNWEWVSSLRYYTPFGIWNERVFHKLLCYADATGTWCLLGEDMRVLGIIIRRIEHLWEYFLCLCVEKSGSETSIFLVKPIIKKGI